MAATASLGLTKTPQLRSAKPTCGCSASNAQTSGARFRRPMTLVSRVRVIMMSWRAGSTYVPGALVSAFASGLAPPTPPSDLNKLEQIVSSASSSVRPWIDGGCPGKSFRASFYTQTSGSYAVTSTCGTALENKDLRLTCPYGTVITSVKFASFGTPTYMDAGKAACLTSGTSTTFPRRHELPC